MRASFEDHAILRWFHYNCVEKANCFAILQCSNQKRKDRLMNEKQLDFLRNLVETPGVSGYEQQVRKSLVTMRNHSAIR